MALTEKEARRLLGSRTTESDLGDWSDEDMRAALSWLDATRARLAEVVALNHDIGRERDELVMARDEIAKHRHEMYLALAAREAECAELRAALAYYSARYPDSVAAGLLSRAPGGTEALRAHTARAITETAREIARRIEALYQFMEKQPGDLTGNRLADEVETMILTDYTDADDPDFKRLVARLLPADAARGDAMEGGRG